MALSHILALAENREDQGVPAFNPKTGDLQLSGRNDANAKGVAGMESFGPVPSEAPELLFLHVASNPFDHLDLLEEGVLAYEQTSDARVDDRLLDIRKILRDGFRGGRLDLLLLVPYEDSEGPGLKIKENHNVFAGQDVATSASQNNLFCGKRLYRADLASHSPLLSPATIPQIVGFDVVSVHRNWLQGHLLFLRPAWRGKGLVAAYFNAALALARSRGLDGMFFWSTLERWLQKPPEGFTMKGSFKQSNGVVVRSFWREV